MNDKRTEGKTGGPDKTATRYAIAVVERETGILKDTLRVWERRYGFPQPERDAFGERGYSPEEVNKLRIIKRLIDIGHRPGKLVQLSHAELSRMGEPRELRRHTSRRDAYSVEKRSHLKAYLTLLEQDQAEQLRRQLTQAQMHMGFARLVTDRVAPLAQMISDLTLSERLPRYAQQVFVQMAQRLLHHAIGNMPENAEPTGPRVLLASFGDESTGLDLLMIEALLALEGCRCIAMGTHVSAHDVSRGAAAYQADLTVLHCDESTSTGERQLHLDQLRALLPAAHPLWVQGCGKALSRKLSAGIQALDKLEALSEALSQWRKAKL